MVKSHQMTDEGFERACGHVRSVIAILNEQTRELRGRLERQGLQVSDFELVQGDGHTSELTAVNRCTYVTYSSAAYRAILAVNFRSSAAGQSIEITGFSAHRGSENSLTAEQDGPLSHAVSPGDHTTDLTMFQQNLSAQGKVCVVRRGKVIQTVDQVVAEYQRILESVARNLDPKIGPNHGGPWRPFSPGGGLAPEDSGPHRPGDSPGGATAAAAPFEPEV